MQYQYGRNEAEKFEALQGHTPDEKKMYLRTRRDTLAAIMIWTLSVLLMVVIWLRIYGLVDVDDKVGAEVLRLTSGGLTQVEIAEACGISVYRVRKYQTGAI